VARPLRPKHNTRRRPENAGLVGGVRHGEGVRASRRHRRRWRRSSPSVRSADGSQLNLASVVGG